MLTKEELAHIGLGKLIMRFENKIDYDEYYLSYSGGLDSHLLYWFIKEILQDNRIKIVAVNTYREHNEIRERMYKYSDEVLYPTMKMKDIKEKYGIPCFTKMQDEIIRRYQKGSRAPYTMSRVMGIGTVKFGLNKTAKTKLLDGTLHKVSGECCKYTKKEPFRIYEKKTGLKAIIATRGAESITRKNAYRTCLTTKGKFTPIYDFTDEMIKAIYEVHEIEKPKVYEKLDRTGCVACPYGMHGKKNTVTELEMVTPAQRKYAIDSFGESYKVLGVKVDD
jgi:3'-phosphoadenosine 5'-phosphosulfate sulfotransferase (PAPS reductase)/FAD synthetase